MYEEKFEEEKDMTETAISNVRCAAGLTSERAWIAAGEQFELKILSVDEIRKTAEFMGRIKAGYRSGKHRHICETHLLVIEGRLKNHTTGVEFGPGDYCYQPKGDVHDEEALENSLVYDSYRAETDGLVEFFDSNGKVEGQFTLSELSKMLP